MGVFPVRIFFGQGGGEVLQIRTSALFGAKNFRFRNLLCVRTDMRGEGLTQCVHFADKGERGQFFAILCGRLLWTALNIPYSSTPYVKHCHMGHLVLAHLFDNVPQPRDCKETSGVTRGLIQGSKLG